MPNAVITDQGNVEILAVKSAFAGEGVRIFFCAWHVYRVWEREVPKRILGISHLPLGLRSHIKAAVRSYTNKSANMLTQFEYMHTDQALTLALCK